MLQPPPKGSLIPRDRLVPLIVAVALFMENMDSTVIATSLPAIAHDIGTNPLALKLAVTSYLLSLAVFIPASGWTADRFGARTVFRAAIAVFMLGSIGCALSGSLTGFVLARIVQGMGGAMMTPVGRLILVRSIDRRALVAAMTWVTMPALVGPVIGPPVGGFITTYASWHWIFLINIPIGVIGLVLVTRFIDNIRAEAHDPFDLPGMVLAGLGMAGLAFGLSVLGLDFLPWPIVAALIGGGALATLAYVAHARRAQAPVLDLSLFALDTFRASVGGGFAFRIGVGAFPFLLPLLLQLGFNFTPFQSGLITFSSALGAMGMKTVVPRILRRFGFRSVLVWNALISSVFLAACAAFTPRTPVEVMIAVLLVGGFFRSLQFTSINSLAYADVDARRISRATTLVSVAQQLAISSGVAVGALAVHATLYFRHSAELGAGDFAPAFLFVAAISAASVAIFARLPPHAGAELASRVPAPVAAPSETSAEASDQRAG
jgi:EmrB/QacA subfamily drug resistance transporter